MNDKLRKPTSQFQYMETKDPIDMDAAVERLYYAFNKYSTWSHQPGCPCCTDPDLAVPLRTKKIRDLTHTELVEFGNSALLTWGNADDFRHFLPRLFELSTVEPETQTMWDTGMVFNKLGHGDWRSWPVNKQKAIEGFLNQWWLTTLMTFEPSVAAGDVFTAIAQAHENLEPFLSAWRGMNTGSAFHNFAHSWWRLTGNAWLNGDQHRQVKQWLHGKETRAWLEAGFFAHFDEPWASCFAQSIDEVDALV
jgi:hypothetical protein